MVKGDGRDARAGLNEALRAFTRRRIGADVALVFYAGHGMEMDGVTYLLPVDARLAWDTDVRYETVTLDDVLAATTGASLRMVILDACRDNPLARSLQRTVARRSISVVVPHQRRFADRGFSHNEPKRKTDRSRGGHGDGRGGIDRLDTSSARASGNQRKAPRGRPVI